MTTGHGGREDNVVILHDDECRVASCRREGVRGEGGGDSAEGGWIIGLKPDDAVRRGAFQAIQRVERGELQTVDLVDEMTCDDFT